LERSGFATGFSALIPKRQRAKTFPGQFLSKRGAEKRSDFSALSEQQKAQKRPAVRISSAPHGAWATWKPYLELVEQLLVLCRQGPFDEEMVRFKEVEARLVNRRNEVNR